LRDDRERLRDIGEAVVSTNDKQPAICHKKRRICRHEHRENIEYGYFRAKSEYNAITEIQML